MLALDGLLKDRFPGLEFARFLLGRNLFTNVIVRCLKNVSAALRAFADRLLAGKVVLLFLLGFGEFLPLPARKPSPYKLINNWGTCPEISGPSISHPTTTPRVGGSFCLIFVSAKCSTDCWRVLIQT